MIHIFAPPHSLSMSYTHKLTLNALKHSWCVCLCFLYHFHLDQFLSLHKSLKVEDRKLLRLFEQIHLDIQFRGKRKTQGLNWNWDETKRKDARCVCGFNEISFYLRQLLSVSADEKDISTTEDMYPPGSHWRGLPSSHHCVCVLCFNNLIICTHKSYSSLTHTTVSSVPLSSHLNHPSICSNVRLITYCFQFFHLFFLFLSFFSIDIL